MWDWLTLVTNPVCELPPNVYIYKHGRQRSSYLWFVNSHIVRFWFGSPIKLNWFYKHLSISFAFRRLGFTSGYYRWQPKLRSAEDNTHFVLRSKPHSSQINFLLLLFLQFQDWFAIRDSVKLLLFWSTQSYCSISKFLRSFLDLVPVHFPTFQKLKIRWISS